MSTKIKEAPETLQKAEQSPPKGKFAQEDLIAAVENAFKKVKGRIDPRYLWTVGGVHRFRVNCWSEVAMIHSEFVHVIEEDKKLIVKRQKP